MKYYTNQTVKYKQVYLLHQQIINKKREKDKSNRK